MNCRTSLFLTIFLLVNCTLKNHRINALERLAPAGTQVLETADMPNYLLAIPGYSSMQQSSDMTASVMGQDDKVQLDPRDMSHVLYTIKLSIPVYSDINDEKGLTSPAQSHGSGQISQESARDGNGVKILTSIIGCRECRGKNLFQGHIRGQQPNNQQRLASQDQSLAKLKGSVNKNYADRLTSLPSVREYSFADQRPNNIMGFPDNGKSAYSGGKFVGFSESPKFGDSGDRTHRDVEVQELEQIPGMQNQESIYYPDTQYTVYLNNNNNNNTEEAKFKAKTLPGIGKEPMAGSSQNENPHKTQAMESNRGWAPEFTLDDVPMRRRYLTGEVEPNLTEVFTPEVRRSKAYYGIMKEETSEGSKPNEIGFVQKRFRFFPDPFTKALAEQKARQERERRRIQAKARHVIKTLYEILKKKMERRNQLASKW